MTNIPISLKPMDAFIYILAITKFVFLNITIGFLGKNKLYLQIVILLS